MYSFRFAPFLTCLKLVNKQIFESRWRAKIGAVTVRYGPPPKGQPTNLAEEEAFLKILVNWLYDIIQHIHFCSREAQSVGVQLPSLEVIEKLPEFVQTTVLAEIEYQRIGTQLYIEKLQQGKNGGRFHDRFRWQQLSLPIRRRTNELLDAVEGAEREGHWVIDEKALRVYEIMRKFDGRDVQLRREEEGFAGRPQDRRTLPEGAGA